MIQVDSVETHSSTCQKEYSAFYYDQLLNYKQHSSINFQHPNQTQSRLPVAFIDTIRAAQTLYLLRWQTKQKLTAVFIKAINEEQWLRITMNHLPLKIAITDKSIFLIGVKQLFIASLDSTDIKRIELQNSKIVDLKLCYTQYNEPGVYTVYFNQKEGYFSREYSKSFQPSPWNKFKFILTAFTKQKSQYQYFQTILPNVLGLALSQNSLFIYDLRRMTLTNLMITLEKMEIKLMRWHLTLQEQNAQKMNIFILANNKIVCFDLHIKKLRLEGKGPQISLKQIARGNVIDWDNTTFKKSQQFQISSELTITDFIVSDNFLVYREEKQNCSSVPIINKIALNQFAQTNSIITQESSVWRQYYAQPQSAKSFINKFKNQIEEWGIAKKIGLNNKRKVKMQGDCLHYLNKLRNYNKFQQFFTYKGEVYILRSHSITLLYNIPLFHYHLQRYIEEDRGRDQELKMNSSLAYDKQHQLSSFDNESIYQEYKNIISYMKQAIQNIQSKQIQMTLTHNQGLPDKFVILMNTLRDRIDYYCGFVNYVINQLKFNEKSDKNNQIIRIIQYLHQSYTRHDDQAQIFGSNFLQMLMQENQRQIEPNVQSSTIMMIKKMFQNMLPDSFISGKKQPKDSFSTNQYLQFIISLIDTQEQPAARHLIEMELRLIVQTLFPLAEDQTQNYILANISYVKAYLICHSSQEDSELLLFCRHLTKLSNYKAIIDGLSDTFHLIPNQLNVLIKAEMQLKKNKVCTNIFFNRNQEDKTAQQQPQESYLQERARKILSSQFNKKMNKQDIEKQFYEECMYIEGNSYQTFQFDDCQLFALHAQLCQLNINNNTQSDIIQLEQNMLRGLTNLFTSQFFKTNTVSRRQFAGFQNFLHRLLIQIDILFISFKKYYKQHFLEDTSQGPIYNFNGIAKKISEEQGIMCSQFIDGPIRLIGQPLSSILIDFMRKIISSQSMIKLLVTHRFDWKSDQFTNQFLKHLLSADKITSQEIDLFYYCFLKKGERYMKKFMSKISKEASSKVIAYFQKVDKKDILYLMPKELNLVFQGAEELSTSRAN